MKNLLITAKAITVLSFLGLSFNISQASDGVRTVALSYMPTPDSDELFGDVGHFGISLNNRGETAFIASPSFNQYDYYLFPKTPINDESIWTEAGGSGLRRIAREGTGFRGDGTFAIVGNPVISDVGETLYLGSFTDSPNLYASSLWRNSLGDVSTPVVESGSIAPSTDATFWSVTKSSVNTFGNAAAIAELGLEATVYNYEGVWVELGGGSLELVARRGDIAPGTGGKLYENFQHLDLGLGGHVTFNAFLRGTGVNASNDQVIYVAEPTGNVYLAVREGAAVSSVGGSFRNINIAHINRYGDIVFIADVLQPQQIKDTLWRKNDLDDPILVAMQGEQAPGTNAIFDSNYRGGTVFSSSFLGDGGHVTFNAHLLENNETKGSIWLAEPNGDLKLVVKEGDLVPGTNDAFVDLGIPTINAHGQVAFSGRRIDFTNEHYGIWAQDKNGNLRTIALAGELFDVSDDPDNPDLRTIRYLSFREQGNFHFGEITGFNDRGQIAFFARFTDGTSGVFVSNAVAVPEPTYLGIGALLTLLHLASRGERRQRDL
jgi:hypothetical protein